MSPRILSDSIQLSSRVRYGRERHARWASRRIVILAAAVLGLAYNVRADDPPFVGPPVSANPGLYGYTHSSTAHESILRGKADVHRSLGERRLLESEAARRYEDARSRYFDNAVKYLIVRDERRRIGEAHRHEQNEERQRRREIAQYLSRQRKSDFAPSVDAAPVVNTVFVP